MRTVRLAALSPIRLSSAGRTQDVENEKCRWAYLLVESAQTQGAGVRPLSRVNPLVFPQGPSVAERLHAVAAAVGSLARVSTGVDLVALSTRERLAAK